MMSGEKNGDPLGMSLDDLIAKNKPQRRQSAGRGGRGSSRGGRGRAGFSRGVGGWSVRQVPVMMTQLPYRPTATAAGVVGGFARGRHIGRVSVAGKRAVRASVLGQQVRVQPYVLRETAVSAAPAKSNKAKKAVQQQSESKEGFSTGTVVLVEPLNSDIVADDIEELFSQDGVVKSVTLSLSTKSAVTGDKKGSAQQQKALVKFKLEKDARKAIARLNGRPLDGTPMKVSILPSSSTNIHKTS